MNPKSINDVFCEAQDLPKSSLVVELKYAQELEHNYKLLIQDTCDTDTYIRERVKGIITEKEIDGDSYCVPSIENIVDSLCKIIENSKVKDNTEEKLAEGFVKGVFEIVELKKEIKKLKQQLNLQGVALTNTAEMLEMQTKTKEEIDKNTIWIKTTPEEYERDFINLSKAFIEIKEQNEKLKEMFDMQVKLVTALELEKMELAEKIKYLELENKEFEKAIHHQTKKVSKLELENEELRDIIKSLTKGKLPCNPDHNGECLVCDNWLSDCPLAKK